MANIYDDVFDPQPGKAERAGFRSRRRYIGRAAGSERLGASVWEVPPGEAAYPYHYHLTEEELLVVLDGDGELRTASGWRPLERGEVVAFVHGERGAHQVRCVGPATLRFLTVSTNGEPDIVLYPDSGKVGVAERLPGGGGLWEFYRRTDAVDYWDGEPEAPGGLGSS